MMNAFRTTVLGTAFAIAAILGSSAALAVPIPLLSTAAAPVLSDSDPSASNVPGFLGLTFVSSGTGSTTAPAAASGLSTTLTADLDSTGGVGALGGGFTITDGPTFLAGDLQQSGFEITSGGRDTIGLLFAVTGGSAAAEFGPLVLATLTGDFGDDVAAVFGSGFTAPASLDLRPATVVPLPATLPLLVGALALIALRRRTG